MNISACAFLLIFCIIEKPVKTKLREKFMRISDIKQMFGSKDKEVIIEALCKTYQYVSKRDKEDLDEILNALTKEVKEEEDKKEITFDEMKKAVNKFREDTYSQYYYINKKKLSLQKITWVKVMLPYIKAALAIKPGDEHYVDSSAVLAMIVKCCTYGESHYAFHSCNVFTKQIPLDKYAMFMEALKRKTYGLPFGKESLEKSFKFACFMVQGEYLYHDHGIIVWNKLQDLYEEDLKQQENKELIYEFLKEKAVKCLSGYQKVAIGYNQARKESDRDFFYGLRRKYEEGELYLAVLPALFCALTYDIEAKDLFKLLFSTDENGYHRLICELRRQYKDKLVEILKSLQMKNVDDYIEMWLK